mgnify:CR=1 FL=1
MNLFESSVSAAFGEIFRLQCAPLKMTSVQEGLVETALHTTLPPVAMAPTDPLDFDDDTMEALTAHERTARGLMLPGRSPTFLSAFSFGQIAPSP